MDTTIVQSLIGLGPGGIIAVVLFFQMKADRESRLQYDKERLETDKKLAAALMALVLKITGKPFDGDAT